MKDMAKVWAKKFGKSLILKKNKIYLSVNNRLIPWGLRRMKLRKREETVRSFGSFMRRNKKTSKYVYFKTLT